MSNADRLNTALDHGKPAKLSVVEKALHVIARALLYDRSVESASNAVIPRYLELDYIYISAMSINTFALEKELSEMVRQHLSDFVQRLYAMVKSLSDDRIRQQAFLVWKKDCEGDPIIRQFVSQLCSLLRLKPYFMPVSFAFKSAASELLLAKQDFRNRSLLFMQSLEFVAGELSLKTFAAPEGTVLSIYGKCFIIDFGFERVDDVASLYGKLVVVDGNKEKPATYLDPVLKHIVSNMSFAQVEDVLRLLAELDGGSTAELNLVYQLVFVLYEDMIKLCPSMALDPAELLDTATRVGTIKPSFPLWKPFRSTLCSCPPQMVAHSYSASISFEPSERSLNFPVSADHAWSFLPVSNAAVSGYVLAPFEFVLTFDPPVLFCSSLAQRLWFFALDSLQTPLFMPTKSQGSYLYDLLCSVPSKEATQITGVLTGAHPTLRRKDDRWISFVQVSRDQPKLSFELSADSLQSTADPGAQKGSYQGIIVRRLPLKLLRKLQASVSVLKGQLLFNELVKSCLFSWRYPALDDADQTFSSELQTVEVSVAVSTLTIYVGVDSGKPGGRYKLTVMVKSKPTNPTILVNSEPPVSPKVSEEFSRILSLTNELPLSISYFLKQITVVEQIN